MKFTKEQLRRRFEKLMLSFATKDEHGCFHIDTDFGKLSIHLIDSMDTPWFAMQFTEVEKINQKMGFNDKIIHPFLYGMEYNKHTGKWNLMYSKCASCPTLAQLRYQLYARLIQQLISVTSFPNQHPLSAEFSKLYGGGS